MTASTATGLVGAVGRVWATELGCVSVGSHDDFFALGGTSLGAARVVAALRDTLGLDATFADLLHHPTPAALAATVRAGVSRNHGILPHLSADAMPRVSVQQEAIWHDEQVWPDNAAYQTLAVLDLPEAPERGRLVNALAALTTRHALLRSSFPVRHGVPVIRRHAAPVVHLDDARPDMVRDADPRLRAAWLRELGRSPIDRSSPGLLRWTLAGRHLILVQHRLLHDGWSLGRLVTELAHLYRTGSAGGLPDLPHGYADYAAWQRVWLHSDAAATSRGFWADLPSMPVEPLRLRTPARRPSSAGRPLDARGPSDARRPLDARQPEAFTFEGDAVHRRIPDDVVAAAQSAAKCLRTTVFVVLMAAFAATIGALGGADRFTLSSLLRNRRVPGTEHVLGPFANTIALPVRVGRDQTLRGLAAALAEMLTHGMDHQEVPPPVNPHAQVCFSMNDSPYLSPDWGSWRARLHYPSNGTARCDLDVVLVPDYAGYTAHWRYSTALLTAAETTAIGEAFHDVVRAGAAKPDASLARVVAAVIPDGRR